MSGALLEVQAALLAYLRSQPSLAVWLGTPARVHDHLPAEVIYPYVSFGWASLSPIGSLGGDVSEQVLTLRCVSHFGGSEEAKAIAAELRVVLDDAELTLAGHRLVSLRVSYVDVFRSSDQKTSYAVVRLRAVTEAL